MNNEKKLNEIIEWLYVNDHNCSSAKDWKEKLIKKLREVICGESYQLGVSSQSAGVCPTHGYKNDGVYNIGK